MLYNRIVVVNRRLYQVMFSMRGADDLPESANAFIRSFRLTR